VLCFLSCCCPAAPGIICVHHMDVTGLLFCCMVVRGWLSRVLALTVPLVLTWFDFSDVVETSERICAPGQTAAGCATQRRAAYAGLVRCHCPSGHDGLGSRLIDYSKAAGPWCCLSCLLMHRSASCCFCFRVRCFWCVHCFSNAGQGGGLFSLLSAPASGCRWCVCLWHTCKAGCVPTP
jgi:hypothetical protein